MVIKNSLLYCFILILFLFISKAVSAQVSFFENERPITIDQKAIQFYIDSSTNRTFNRFEQIKLQLKSLRGNNINLSNNNEMLWLKIPLSAILSKEQIQYMIVRNSHINFLNLWLIKGNTVVKAFKPTGDHLPFITRTIIHPDFVFPFPEKIPDKLAYLILIDKRNEQLNIPIHFLSEKGFLDYNQKKNLLAGLITGLSLFLLMFNFFLFFQTREGLYVYYGLYIFMLFFYSFSDFGLSFMYFFPNQPILVDYTRPIAVSLASGLYMLFSFNLLNIKNKMPVQYKWSLRYLIVYFIFLTIGISLMPETGSLRTVLVLAIQVYQYSISLWILAIAIIALRINISFAAYIIASSLIMIVSFSIFIQFISGYIPDNLLTRNIVNIGFTVELSILAFVLTFRFKNYKIESESLLKKVNEQQNQIFKSISDYQQKEMQRYSSLLHDSVGAKLSAIRLNLESIQLNRNKMAIDESMNRSITDISDLANDVRQFSHNLSPIFLQSKGLVNALEEFIQGINRSSDLYIQFESIGSLQKVSLRYEILVYNILQELIQNILRHSGATEAIIQLILEKEMISMLVEDNGKGIGENSIKDGLGFSQIKNFLTFVQGRLDISSPLNTGCRVSIEFPILEYETSHPTSDS